jgi:hypothetical protein
MRVNGVYIPDDLEFEIDENGELVEVKKETTQTEPDITEELLDTYKYRIPKMLYRDLIWLDGVLTRAHEIKDDYYNSLLNEVRKLVKRQIPIRLEQDKKQKEKEAREAQEEKERQIKEFNKDDDDDDNDDNAYEHWKEIKDQKERKRQTEINNQVERERQHLERQEIIYEEKKNNLTGGTRFTKL